MTDCPCLDYEMLLELLEPGSPLIHSIRKSLSSLQPRLDAAQKKETDEMLGKLKGVGNSLLGRTRYCALQSSLRLDWHRSRWSVYRQFQVRTQWQWGLFDEV